MNIREYLPTVCSGANVAQTLVCTLTFYRPAQTRRLKSALHDPRLKPHSELGPLDKPNAGRYYRAMLPRVLRRCGILLAFTFLSALQSFGSEADIKIPDLGTVNFNVQGNSVSGMLLLYIGLVVCVF